MVHRFKKIMKLFFKKKDVVSSVSSPGVSKSPGKIPGSKPKGPKPKGSAAPPLETQRKVIDVINKRPTNDGPNSGLSKSFFSKYLPLPNIGEKEKLLVERRRKLMRRDTYVVLKPKYVKGSGPGPPETKKDHSPECHGKKPKQNIKTQRITFKEKLKDLRKNAKSIEETSNGAFWVEM